MLLISDVSGFFGGTFENLPAIRIEAINSSSGIGRKIRFFQVSTRFLWMYMKLLMMYLDHWIGFAVALVVIGLWPVIPYLLQFMYMWSSSTVFSLFGR